MLFGTHGVLKEKGNEWRLFEKRGQSEYSGYTFYTVLMQSDAVPHAVQLAISYSGLGFMLRCSIRY